MTSFTSVMASKSDQQRVCGFCHRGAEADDICGPLCVEKDVAAHRKCMQYSAKLIQYKIETKFGGFKIKKVQKEIRRGQQLHCCICKAQKKPGKKGGRMPTGGATCGCAIKKCKLSFHFYCAHQSIQAITQRLKVTNKKKKKVVMYRVFCSEEHQREFEETITDEMDCSDISDSDPDGDSVDECDVVPQSSYEDSTPVMPVLTPMVISKAKPLPHSAAKVSSEPLQSSDDLPTNDENRTKSSKEKQTLGTVRTTSGENRQTPIVDNNNKKKRMLGTDISLPPSPRSSRSSSSDRRDSPRSKWSSPRVTKSGGSSRSDHLPAPKRRHRQAASPSSASAAAKLDSSVEKLRIQANPEDCILCLFEQSGEARGSHGDNVGSVMQQMARQLYGVPQSSVYIWQYHNDSHDTTLSNKHMLYLFKDISQALTGSQLDISKTLEQLIFLSDADISVYTNYVNLHAELGSELEAKIIDEISKQIHTYFKDAKAKLKDDVGCMLHADSLGGNVLFLRLCPVIDPSHVIRNRFGYQPDLVMWDDRTTLGNFTSDCRTHNQSHERETLLKWLGENVNSPRILSYPDEAIFRQEAVHSTTYQLERDYQKESTVSPE